MDIKLPFAKFSIEFSRIHPEITCSAFPYRRRKIKRGFETKATPPISQMQGPQRVRLQLSCPARKSDSETISFLIKQSKTDQIKKGHFVYIFNLSSPIQPYQAVREYLRLRISQAKSPLEPLFLDHAGNPVSRTWFQKQLKSILLSAGISATNFSSHSFRIGAATSAAQKGLTKHQIQTLGRWSSEAFQSYIRTDQFHIKSAHQTLIS